MPPKSVGGIPDPVHFVGVGGIGMSAIAAVLAARGLKVSGSDRFFDRGERADDFRRLARAGIRLSRQDGSGVTSRVKGIVVSTAIERSNPDLGRARALGIPSFHRSEILSLLADGGRGIAVAGSSGKSTTAGILGWILAACGWDPTVVNGAAVANFEGPAALGNARAGSPSLVVFEADESDGTVVEYRPFVTILTRVDRDHGDPGRIRGMFERLLSRTLFFAVGLGDDPAVRAIVRRHPRGLLFGERQGSMHRVAAIRPEAAGVSWRFLGTDWHLPVPGRHNALNASAAILAARTLHSPPEGAGLGLAWGRAGDPLPEIRRALARFRGIRRRLERLGEARGVLVFDDYAHNGAKVEAACSALRGIGRRLRVLFQPHGFGPARFLGQDWGRAFRKALGKDGRVFVLPIYDAGGTADRSISSEDLASAWKRLGVPCEAVPRENAAAAAASACRKGDLACVMGARDPALPALGRAVLRALRGR